MVNFKISEIQNLYNLMGAVDDKSGAAPIDYENPQKVAGLMAKHLAKIFGATL